MEKKENIKILRSGIPKWNEHYRGIGFSFADFSGADLSKTELFNPESNTGDERRIVLNNADLSGANLEHANLEEAALASTQLENANLSRANLKSANLEKANLDHAYLLFTDLSAAKLAEARLNQAKLIFARLSRADLRSARLLRANLHSADLRGADLKGAQLDGADLRDVKFNGLTSLRGASVKGTKIGRYDLECLENYGGLAKGERMEMEIEDGVALLRSTYSGFLQWLHLVSLAAFLCPYLWFIAAQWSKARFVTTPESGWLPLWEALSRFIYNGGIDWQLGWILHWSFFAFVFLFAYNLLRGVLLWKTKALELEEESRGLPARFSLSKDSWNWPWGLFFQLARWGFYANLLVVLFNTGHFFTQLVPATP